MMLSKAILVGVVVLGLAACRTDMVLSENRHFPRVPEFTIAPGNYAQDHILDYGAIYANYHETTTNGRTSGTYNYFRFWPNGRVLIDYAERLPTVKEADDFSNAILGYFVIHGRDIVLEFFSFNPGTWRWDYSKDFGYVENNRIVITGTDWGGDTAEYPLIFEKYSLPGLARAADW